MAETKEKMISIRFSKEDMRQLNVLKDMYEENYTQVVRRAISMLHYDATYIAPDKKPKRVY